MFKKYDKKKLTTSLLVMASISVLISVSLLASRGVFESDATKELIFKSLTDCFFVPGWLFVCAGGLVWVAHMGQFDFLGFTARRIKRQFLSGNVRDYDMSYYDYLEKRKEKRREKDFPIGLFIIGVIDLVLMLILWGVYHIVI